MRNVLLTLAFCASLLSGTHAHSRELVVALSPHHEPTLAKEQATTVLKFLTELEPGDHATLVDGFNLTLLGEFTVPDDPKYRSPKARLGANRKAVSALLRFSKASQIPAGSHPTVTGALRLPQLLRYLGENFSTEETIDVLVIGSPLYEDRDTPALSMTGERYPGDGHLYRNGGETPYGASGNPALLENLNVHIAFGEGLPGSERHDHFVQRYWMLFVEHQGGTLSRFVRDLPTLFRQVKRNAAPVKHSHHPERTDKLDIIRLAPVTVKQSIYDRPVTTTPLSKANARRAEDVQVGLSWQCDECDLDLYALPHPGAAILNYSNTASPLGRYWKDHTRSPKATNGQETIGFTVPLDLRALRLAVNYYSGNSPNGVAGEIRLSVDGDTYAMPFRINATAGNKGSGMKRAMETGKASSEHTVFINPLSIVGLQ